MTTTPFQLTGSKERKIFTNTITYIQFLHKPVQGLSSLHLLKSFSCLAFTRGT